MVVRGGSRCDSRLRSIGLRTGNGIQRHRKEPRRWTFRLGRPAQHSPPLVTGGLRDTYFATKLSDGAWGTFKTLQSLFPTLSGFRLRLGLSPFRGNETKPTTLNHASTTVLLDGYSGLAMRTWKLLSTSKQFKICNGGGKFRYLVCIGRCNRG
ncbi:hypothetical protein LF1_22330 [Rubripirellula obstinata]|uniref:Uncharacterized protein n=1 Tax=Rubripirellula obstinata TaxID=406547 RepID=A0A5B1CGL0_9BACT|nr:hypothetical protein LF1_22330 [Rubripirellula obstinata]